MELNRENPGATLIWFGQTHRGRPFDSTPVDWRIWCLNEARSRFYWYRDFKSLDNAYTRNQREQGIGPGEELMWFGRHQGRTIASVYADDRSYLNWCLEQPHHAWHSKLEQLVSEYRHEIGDDIPQLEEEPELQYPADPEGNREHDADAMIVEPNSTPGAVLMWFGPFEGLPLYYVAHRRDYMTDLFNNPEHREADWYPRFIRHYRAYREYVANNTLGANCRAAA